MDEFAEYGIIHDWYDDGENDMYLGDPEEDYPYGSLDCE